MRFNPFPALKDHWAFFGSLTAFFAFLASWNWSYLPVTEGWFILAGEWITEGQLPYVDFYAYLPPVYYWLNAALYFVFSDNVDAYRLFGMLVNLLLLLLTYNIFLRWNASKGVSALASLFSMFLVTSGNAFISYDFLYVMRMFALLGFLLLFQGGHLKVVAGAIFLTLAALTKQSDGSVLYFLGCVVLLVFSENRIEKLSLYLITTMIVCVLVFLPFILNGSMITVFDSLVFQAANNKGGISAPLSNLFVHNFFSYQTLKSLISALLPLILFFSFTDWLLRRLLLGYFNEKLKLVLQIIFILILGFCVTIFFSDQNVFDEKLYFDHFVNLAYAAGGFSGLLIFFAHVWPKLFNVQRRSINEASIISFAFILGAGTSGGLTLVSVSFCIGALIVFFDKFANRSIVFRSAAVLYFGAVTFCFAQEKIQRPYHWWGIETPPIETSHFSVLDLEQSRDLQAVAQLVSQCRHDPKTLLAYPHMTMFNIVTDLKPYRNAITFWLDYLSDKHAEAELEALKKEGPDILVFWAMPDLVFEAHSNLFKQGRPTAHKKIAEFLESEAFLRDFYHLKSINNGQNLFKLFGKRRLGCPRT